jgi:hypothetical protein
VRGGPNATLGGASTDSNLPMSLGIPAVTIGGGGQGGNWTNGTSRSTAISARSGRCSRS